MIFGELLILAFYFIFVCAIAYIIAPWRISLPYNEFVCAITNYN